MTMICKGYVKATYKGMSSLCLEKEDGTEFSVIWSADELKSFGIEEGTPFLLRYSEENGITFEPRPPGQLSDDLMKKIEELRKHFFQQESCKKIYCEIIFFTGCLMGQFWHLQCWKMDSISIRSTTQRCGVIGNMLDSKSGRCGFESYHLCYATLV